MYAFDQSNTDKFELVAFVVTFWYRVVRAIHCKNCL